MIFAVCAYSSGLAATDSVQIEGVTLTANDMERLFAALDLALKPNDTTIPIFVAMKKATEMPSYDQRYHYVGIVQDAKGARQLHVWINGDLSGTDSENAIAAVFMLAIADGGYAGPAFKNLYDIFAKKDAQLPASAPDPFLNRHRFAAALVDQLNANHQ